MGTFFSPATRLGRTRLLLVGLAVVFELVNVLYFVGWFPLWRYYNQDIDMEGIQNHSRLSFWMFIAMMTLLFVLLVVAWWSVRDLDDPPTARLILGTGAVFGATLAFVYPMTAIDIFAYVDQSIIMVQYHANPIFVPPSAFPADPVMKLSDGWQGAGAPYGPLALVFDAVPTLIFGHNVLANLLMLKLMFAGATVGCGYLAYAIVRKVRPERSLPSALLIVWNPLFLFEAVVNGHNDVLMMLVCLLGILSLAEGDLMLGVVLMSASALVKYGTVVLLPLALVYGMSRKPTWEERARYAIFTIALSVAVVAVAYFPFWQGPTTLTQVFTSQGGRFLSSFSSFMGDLFGPRLSAAQFVFPGRLLFLLTYLVAVALAVRDFSRLLQGSFIALFFFLVFGLTNVESWYGLWVIALGAAVPFLVERSATVLFSYGASLLALWFGYLWPWDNLSAQGYNLADKLSYLVTFVPALVALVVLVAVRQIRTRSPSEPEIEPGLTAAQG